MNFWFLDASLLLQQLNNCLAAYHLLQKSIMYTWIYSLLSVIAVSLLSLVGVLTLSLNEKKLKQLSQLLVSFAVGALLGGAFIHLIPKSFAQIENQLLVSLLVLLGMFIFFALEKFLRWRHSHQGEFSKQRVQPVATMNLVGDAAHNLIDGMVIAASYLSGVSVGFTTTLAVALHEIPQEIGDFGVLIHSGVSIKKALLLNCFSALTAVFGAILSLVIGSQVEGYSSFLLPITAGNFIYIAASDLIPELHKKGKVSTSLWQLLLLLLGAGVMLLPKLVKQTI